MVEQEGLPNAPHIDFPELSVSSSNSSYNLDDYWR
jgi:hypothetical protein